ncbi:MAG: hypothetical protein EOO90_19020 [Pedobacter sp.]|nr:MAG: hypothetical protein EOO90_19020 [Pedobacter sp.]
MIKKILNKILDRISYNTSGYVSDLEKRVASEQVAQLLLKNQYFQINKDNIDKYSFENVGFRKYSQNSEDGILLFIFSVIGTTNKNVVEICASDGIQCNAANLIINHGWHGLLFDGDKENVKKGNDFYKTHPDTFTLPPKIIHAWITKDNINKLLKENNASGEIDLLSLDMDGVDYWIWKSITMINPRVVVAEVQCIFGKEYSVTVPYADDFKTEFVNGFGVYSGASILAFIKLAKKKGYRLVGFEKYGFNAFFIRDDVSKDYFPEISIDKYEEIPFVKWAKSEFLDLIKNKEWVKV